jgi:hypothetical protein
MKIKYVGLYCHFYHVLVYGLHRKLASTSDIFHDGGTSETGLFSLLILVAEKSIKITI